MTSKGTRKDPTGSRNEMELEERDKLLQTDLPGYLVLITQNKNRGFKIGSNFLDDETSYNQIEGLIITITGGGRQN